MRLAVVGAGAIGGFVAAHAALAGHRVTVCVRTPFERLVLEDAGGMHHAEVTVATDPSSVEPADWVFVAVKAVDTPAIGPWLDAAVGADTEAVVVLQNGPEGRERVAPLVRPGVPVVPTVVTMAAELMAPGWVRHHVSSTIEVEAGPLAERLAAVFATTPVRVTPSEDFVTSVWRKLVLNSVTNSITALTGHGLEVFGKAGIRPAALALGEEAAAVGRAEGAALPEGFVADLLDRFASTPLSFGTSMLYDRRAGRPLEHDAITGAVVRAGRRHGIATPVTEAVDALLGCCGHL